MLTQTIPSVSFDRTTPTIHTYIVTLLKRATDEEASFTLETTSTRFCDILREIMWQKVERGLFGYELFEALDCNDDESVPF